MIDHNEIRDGLTNLTDQQIESVLISNKQHAKTARILKGLIAGMFLLIVSFAFLYFSEEKPNLRTVWFDRQREHSNEAFKKVDEKYPAAFEVWEGSKLIERWHWKIPGQPQTEQFGDYILRCVAIYDQDEYVGFNQTVMDHYPSENAGDAGYYKNNPKPGSIEFTLNLKESFFVIESDNIGILWENGKLKHSYALSSNFKHKYSTTNDLHKIIENFDHYEYIAHLSDMFPFLGGQIIKPFSEINPEFAAMLATKTLRRSEIKRLEHITKLVSKRLQNTNSRSKLSRAIKLFNSDIEDWKSKI